MSKTISINAGSSSVKWQLYSMPEEKVLAKGLIERIGLKDSISTVKFDGRSERQTLDIADHTQTVSNRPIKFSQLVYDQQYLRFGVQNDHQI